MKRLFVLLQAVAVLMLGGVGYGQLYDPTPPPSPWGPADEAGNTNLLTAEKALGAKKHIKTGVSFVLAHDSQNGMPLAVGNSWVQTAKGPLAVNKQVANADQIVADFTQDGTQFDALCHMGYLPNGPLAPVTDTVYYKQFHHLDVVGVEGLKLCGVEKLRPYVTKAILVDVSRYLFANQVMPEGTAITVDMTLATLAAQGLSAKDVEPGDVVMFRTGWERNWSVTPGSIQSTLNYYKGFPGVPGGVPGVSLDLAVWLSEKRVAAVGANNWGVDVVPAPNPPPGITLPVHNHLLTRGIPLLESLKPEALADHLANSAGLDNDKSMYEFAFFFSPIRVKGGSGSPASPVAVT